MTKIQKHFVVLAVLSAFVLLPGVAKAQNLIAYWPMDDADDAVSGTAGTLEGGASLVDGALSLDGVDGRLATNVAAPTGNGTDGWTVAAWIQTSTTGIYYSNKPPVDSVPSDQIILRVDSDTVLEGDVEGIAYITSDASSTPITDGQFHHVVLSMPADGAGSSTWYLDGAALGTSANVAGTALPAESVVFIGWGTDTSGVNDYFTGLIDDVRIYDDALDAAAVQALFDAGLGPPPPPPTPDDDGDGLPQAVDMDGEPLGTGVEEGTGTCDTVACCDADVNCIGSPADYDDDGVNDGIEVALGFDPLSGASTPPISPVMGLTGLALLSLGLLAGGAALVRRKK